MALVDIQSWAAIFAKKRSRLTSAKMYKFLHLPATVKLSVLLAVKLRHITVVSFLMNILDAVTCSVEVKLAFRAVPLTLMREAVNGPRIKVAGGISLVLYVTGCEMSRLRHSREIDPSI